MKNSFKSLIAVVAATAALVGCSKDAGIDSTPETKGFSINLVTDGQIAGDTRTEFDEAINNIKWSAGDAAKIYLKSISNESTAEITETSGGKNTATFKGTVGSALTAGTYKIQGFYPSSAFYEHHQSADKTNIVSYALTLPSEQTASLASFDKNADILIAQDMDIEITESDIAAHSKTIENFRFGRAMAISKYTFSHDAAQTQLSKDEVVEYVTLTVESSKTVNLTGRFRFDPATGQFVKELTATTPIEDMNNVFYSLGSPSVTVKFSENVTLGNLVMWAVTAPVKLVSGDVLKFTIKTDKNTIVRTSTLTKEFNYLNNQLNTATVNLGTENIEITPKPAGITATLTMDEMETIRATHGASNAYKSFSYTNTFGFWSGYASTNKSNTNYGLQINTTSNNSYILTPKLDGAIKSIELSLIEASKNSVYLNTSLSTSNPILSHTPTSTVNTIIFDLSTLPETYSQVYIVGGSVQIKNITIVWEEATNPRINADNIMVSAADGDSETTYEVKNSTSDVAEEPVTDGTVVETAIAGNGTVAYSVTPNYGTEAREGWIELALADNASVKKRIIVTQSGSTFKVSKTAVDIPNDATETTFTVLSKEFDWTITAPAGITVTPSSGSAGNTEIPVTVSSTTENTGTDPLLLGSLSILRTGDEVTNALTIEVNKLAAGGIVVGTTWKSVSPLTKTTPGISVGSSAINQTYGVQVLSTSSPCTFTKSDYADGISSITINASTSNKGVGTVEVKVGGTNLLYKNNKTLSLSKVGNADKAYTFTAPSDLPLTGEVIVTVKCTTNSLYFKQVTIN